MNEELIKTLEKGVSEVFTSEKYLNYLNLLSRFHKYSISNTLLIFLQNPEASYVTGYNNWKKMKRYVKKGEKSIKILAPIIRKKEVEEDSLEKEEMVLSGFRPVSVFDISQTDGEELPTICNELTGDVEDFDELFEKLQNIAQIPVFFKTLKTSKGYYSHEENSIVINAGMSQTQTIKTMVHELAHSILHENSDKSRNTAEVEAESVAYVVCNQMGINTSDYSFDYIATWSSGRQLKELKSSLDTIKNTANDIIDKLRKAD